MKTSDDPLKALKLAADPVRPSASLLPPKPTKGVKHDGGKPPVSLLPSKPLLSIAEVLGFGAEKYDAHNWRSGIATSRLMSAVFRHLLAYNEGEDKDPESGLPHLAHAGAGIMFMLEQHLRGTGEDDRYKA